MLQSKRKFPEIATKMGKNKGNKSLNKQFEQ